MDAYLKEMFCSFTYCLVLELPVLLYILLQSIISWTVVLSHHIKRYSHTLTHIHIHPQNNRRWPLCESANVGIAAGNTAERYLQDGPIWLPLWYQWSLRPTEIDAHVAFLSSGERKRNRMVRDQVSMDGVAKLWPVVLAAPLGQAKPLCHLNTALWPKAVRLLDHAKGFATDLPNFWQNLTFSHFSNCDILDFRHSQTTTLHNSGFLSEYTARTQLLLPGTREERTLHHLVAPRIHCNA
jgi:hypothetical protein